MFQYKIEKKYNLIQFWTMKPLSVHPFENLGDPFYFIGHLWICYKCIHKGDIKCRMIKKWESKSSTTLKCIVNTMHVGKGVTESTWWREEQEARACLFVRLARAGACSNHFMCIPLSIGVINVLLFILNLLILRMPIIDYYYSLSKLDYFLGFQFLITVYSIQDN